MQKKPFNKMPPEEQKEISDTIKKYWMSDSEMQMKEVVGRFNNIGKEVISRILNETDDPPKLRRAGSGLNIYRLRRIKTPERLPRRGFK